jgi:hypothetical protein
MILTDLFLQQGIKLTNHKYLGLMFQNMDMIKTNQLREFSTPQEVKHTMIKAKIPPTSRASLTSSIE